jgi:3-oxoadipate enol-lactonase/4-carboxymuconolactone decarboxylase
MFATRLERYERDQSGVERTLVLVPSLGTTLRVWDGVADALHTTCPTTEILSMDLPGHGMGHAARGPFSIEDLAAQVVVAIGATRSTEFVTIASLSLGGAVALEIARRRPVWLTSIAMFASAARFGHPAGWADLMAQVRTGGTESLRATSATGWFTPEFQQRRPAEIAGLLNELASVDDASYLWCCRALAEYDATTTLNAVATPALVVAARSDQAVTPGAMRQLADELPDAQYSEMDGAHLAIVEHAEKASTLGPSR